MSDEKDFGYKIRPYSANSELNAGTHHIGTYKEFRELILKWGSGRFQGDLIVVGPPGTGKTETALEALKGVEHCYIKGDATKFGLYCDLVSHIDMPVVLDDVDNLVQDKSVTGILKALLDTKSPKRIQWKSATTMKEDSSLPPEIVTNSRTLVLANELKIVSKNFNAVVQRTVPFFFSPTAAEIHKYVGSWYPVSEHKDIYDYIGDRIELTPAPSCRPYYKCIAMKQAGLDWRQIVDSQLRPSDQKTTLMKDLLNKYEGQKGGISKAVEDYCEATGESMQAAYAVKRAVELAGGKVSKRGQAIREGMKRKHAERKANGTTKKKK